MCGRFVLFSTGEQLLGFVGSLPGVREVVAPDGTPPARYNVAPTHQVPIVRFHEHEALVQAARWGLLPSWKRDDSGPPLFNARGETVAEKPSFRSAMRSQRGIMLLDGYYEWHEKQPYYVTPESGMLVAAALWDTGANRLSTTMVTTDAAERIAWLHHRLPLFLLPEEIEQWTQGTAEEAQELISPSRAAPQLQWHAVGREVGNVRNDSPELIQPI
ncbi:MULTISPECIES: SOS response-associated peptidase [unclassified Corynebacterium]|uniref:SOS response-associated peptidase n=1 Tax=unclassified Corynebacterium TaxID=2624378 RepID=UPI0008A54F15|nr:MULTISPECIES: SOS response-associated peptidase [unclassified Corynebacterium]MCQ4611643.1 SOS response-associated peptidase [Corynebacterium sp. CCUG 51687]OFT31263.1 hypothetical protein HMPREF3170_03415 [Corynebacterium sp. HMSC08D02]